MARPDLNERVRRSGMERFLLADEVILIASRPHWAKVAKPVLLAGAGFALVLLLDTIMPSNMGGLVNLLWLAWLGLMGWAALHVIMWRRNWFIATDKRMLVNHGLRLVNVNVAMLSLSKVVDLSYTRTTMGFLLGYGTLVRESSGSGQTLHDVEWVRHPDETYRTICAAVFGLPDHERRVEEDLHGHRLEDGPPAHAFGRQAEHVTVEARTGPVEFKNEADEAMEPTGIRIRYGESKAGRRETWLGSPDLAVPALRGTGAEQIPYRRSTTDADDGWVPTTGDEDQDLGDQDLGDQDVGGQGDDGGGDGEG